MFLYLTLEQISQAHCDNFEEISTGGATMQELSGPTVNVKSEGMCGES